MIKLLLRCPADALIVSSKALEWRIYRAMETSSGLLNNPILSAKFSPYKPMDQTFIILKKNKDNGATSGSDFPVPPKDLWQGYADTAEEWVMTGREDLENMISILNASDFCLENKRIFDFGCGAGRIIRGLGNIARSSEVRGADVNAKHILWCQQHLSPPFVFTTITTFPHVPFEDGYFDFIYAGSVFTHISDLADMWLLELKRVIRPGGKLYITVHDNRTIEILETTWPDFPLTKAVLDFDKETKFRTSSWGMVSVTDRSPYTAQVFYDREYLRVRCGEEFKVLSITSEAYRFQTAFLLEKPA